MPRVSTRPAPITRLVPASPPVDASALLDTDAAAAVLGIRPQTAAAWRTTGRGPRFIRVSARRIRYRRADLDAWLDAQSRTHTRDVGAAANASAPNAEARGRSDGRTAA